MINEHTLKIEESDRQMILLALGHLVVERPGWDYAIGEVAKKLGDEDGTMLKTFRETAILPNLIQAAHDAHEALSQPLPREHKLYAAVKLELGTALALFAPSIPYEQNLERLIGLNEKTNQEGTEGR